MRKLFDDGQKSGKKVSADKASRLMGDTFPPTEQLSKTQITSLFSRFAADKRRPEEATVTSSDDDDSESLDMVSCLAELYNQVEVH